MSQMNRNKKMEDLRDIAPNLCEIGKGKDFLVPEGYFDHLPDRVLNTIRETGGKEKIGKLFPLGRKMYAAIAMAAAVFAFVTLGYFYIRSLNHEYPAGTKSNSFVYFNMIKEIDEHSIYEFMEEENITPAYLPGQPDDTETIIDYLMDEGVDETLLAQQL